MGILKRFVFSWDRRMLLVEMVVQLITFWMNIRNVLSKGFCVGKIKFAPSKTRKHSMEQRQRERRMARKPRKPRMATEMAKRNPKRIPANPVERLHVDVPF